MGKRLQVPIDALAQIVLLVGTGDGDIQDAIQAQPAIVDPRQQFHRALQQKVVGQQTTTQLTTIPLKRPGHGDLLTTGKERSLADLVEVLED
jgi:hypothetical protein